MDLLSLKYYYCLLCLSYKLYYINIVPKITLPAKGIISIQTPASRQLIATNLNLMISLESLSLTLIYIIL